MAGRYPYCYPEVLWMPAILARSSVKLLNLLVGAPGLELGTPLIKSQLFLSSLFFHASANTRPAVCDCVMM